MQIETKISFNNLKKNKIRTIFTTVSIALCTVLVLTTIILMSSIKNGIRKSIENSEIDYYFIIKDISIEKLNLIENKEYIDKIYIQEDNKELKNWDKETIISNINNINIYIKYTDVANTYKYSSNVIQTLNFSKSEAEEKCYFNENILTIYGLIGTNLTEEDGLLYYRNSFNFIYLINIMIVIVVVFFSALSITILYNAFLITINERKKEYAVLSSVGSTEDQLMKMLMIETTILAVLGIIVGLVISFVLSNIILNVLNNILSATIYNFKISINIWFIILALIIVLFNIYISAIIPRNKSGKNINNSRY